MTMIIRDFRPSDAEAAAASYSAGRPHLVMSPAAVRHLVETASPEQHYRLLVGEADGRVVATGRVGLHAASSTKGQGFANISVLPEARGRGVATAMLAVAERHLAEHGATVIRAWVDDEPSAMAFAEKRGYRRGRSGQFAHLALTAGLPPVPAVPEGVELATAADFLDDPYPLYRVDVDGTLDEPGDVDLDDYSYEDWLAEVWERPDLDRDLTTVVLVDGVPAAFSAVQTDGGTRYWSAFTTTAAAHRGRGLATLAKTDSLHRALARGLTDAYTSNDTTNVPMLAVNERLGYRRCAGEWSYTKDV
ncbi:GNAT family N-acetyltransferase [Kitasatospora sp. NPDC051853]|uniref:GNAT family N-acetyltransferase n=1 Tax=Kitasatospora sp. NPDC051853 TaxID=3364058 RepID=UPI0037B58BD1